MPLLLNRELNDEPIPNQLDATIMYTMLEFPETFGRISHNLLKNVTNYKAKDIFIVFGTYPQPRIKEYDHKLRNNLKERDYIIDGPETKRPAKFLNEMKNIKFKQAFVEFFIKH